jgi:hypothetical protein
VEIFPKIYYQISIRYFFGLTDFIKYDVRSSGCQRTTVLRLVRETFDSTPRMILIYTHPYNVHILIDNIHKKYIRIYTYVKQYNFSKNKG